MPEDGIYTLRVQVHHGYYDEYRFRFTFFADGLQREVESNNAIVTSNALSFEVDGDLRLAKVAGFIKDDLQLSYYYARVAADNRTPEGNIQNPLKVARPIPGSQEFDDIWQPLISKPISQGGGLVIDKSSMYHFEGMYDFSKFFHVK